MIIRTSARAAAACGMALLTALAQANTPAASPAPGAIAYRSAWEGYRPFVDEPVQPWLASNDKVRARGGWRAYAREAAGGESEEAVRPAPAPGPAAAPAHHPHPHHKH